MEMQQPRNRQKGLPYVPSYMDQSKGPEPCVVCGDAATGLHYRCMTCEGCKGFFRRTIQKNLKYFCKENGDCVIDKGTRNQCQFCRFRKCVKIGMATDLVLNDNQREAKRQLIEENRERRKLETIRSQLKSDSSFGEPTSQDQLLINAVTSAYCGTIDCDKPTTSNSHTKRLADWESIVAPYVRRIVNFAKKVPPFSSLNSKDQATLLNSCWLELLIFTIALQFDYCRSALILPSGRGLTGSDVTDQSSPYKILAPVYHFGKGLARLQLDNTEAAMFGALLVLHPDRHGLLDPSSVESAQDEILCALKRYLFSSSNTSNSPEILRWPKILMKLTDLRALSLLQLTEFTRAENSSVLAETLGILN